MKEKLIETARKLKQPPGEAAREFSEKFNKLAETGNLLMAGRPDLEKLVGKDSRSMAEDNNRNFARFMESMFLDYNPEVFTETVLWVFRAYRSHGFQTTYWAANLNIWVELLKKELAPDTFSALYPFYNWLIINIPVFTKLSDEQKT